MSCTTSLACLFRSMMVRSSSSALMAPRSRQALKRLDGILLGVLADLGRHLVGRALAPATGLQSLRYVYFRLFSTYEVIWWGLGTFRMMKAASHLR